MTLGKLRSAVYERGGHLSRAIIQKFSTNEITSPMRWGLAEVFNTHLGKDALEFFQTASPRGSNATHGHLKARGERIICRRWVGQECQQKLSREGVELQQRRLYLFP